MPQTIIREVARGAERNRVSVTATDVVIGNATGVASQGAVTVEDAAAVALPATSPPSQSTVSAVVVRWQEAVAEPAKQAANLVSRMAVELVCPRDEPGQVEITDTRAQGPEPLCCFRCAVDRKAIREGRVDRQVPDGGEHLELHGGLQHPPGFQSLRL